MGLVCKVCAAGEAFRPVFLPIRSPHDCAVCGEALPAMENGFSSGRPADDGQVDRLRAKSGLPALRRPPLPPPRPEPRVGDGYVLVFDDGYAELHIVTAGSKTETRGGFVVRTYKQTKVETRGDADAVRIAARQLGFTEERRGHRFLMTI